MRTTVLASWLAFSTTIVGLASHQALAQTRPPSLPEVSHPAAIQVAPLAPPASAAGAPAQLTPAQTVQMAPPATLLNRIPVPQHMDPSGPFDPGPPGPLSVPLPLPTPYPQAAQTPTLPSHMGTLHESVSLLRYIDPDIPNITCYLTGPVVSASMAQQVASGSSAPQIGLSCGTSGPVHMPQSLQAHKELFLSQNASLWLDRTIDVAQGSIVYTVVSKQAPGGLHLSEVSAVWIAPSGL